MRKSQLIFALLIFCFSGLCCAQTQEEKLLLEKAKSGDAKAAFDVACYYEQNEYNNYQTIVLWLNRSATKGYLEAQFALGRIYHFGKPGIIRDLKKAEFWYEQAALQGDLQARNSLEILRKEPDYKLVSAPDIDERWNMQWTIKWHNTEICKVNFKWDKCILKE